MGLGGLLQELIVSCLQGLLMGLDIVEELGLEGPAKEIELPNGCHKGLVVLDAELDTLPTTICVEILLIISVKLTLI